MAPNGDTDYKLCLAVFKFVAHTSVSLHSQSPNPLEGTAAPHKVRIEGIAGFGWQENVEFFCRDTEVPIWGKSKESLRISTAEMPNARVCSADKLGCGSLL